MGSLIVMASRGQTSMQAKQLLHREALNAGRFGARPSADSGQVTRHNPQAVHSLSIVIVTEAAVFMAYIPWE